MYLLLAAVVIRYPLCGMLTTSKAGSEVRTYDTYNRRFFFLFLVRVRVRVSLGRVIIPMIEPLHIQSPVP